MKSWQTLTLLSLACAAFSCSGKVIALDAPLVEASDDPEVVAIVSERVEKLVVDRERLYWAGSHLSPKNSGATWFLRSCDKRACATTLVTYDSQALAADSLFAVIGDQIYWYRADDGELASCPVAGCNGARRSLATESGFGAATFDSDYFYYSSSDSIFRLPLAEPSSRQLIRAATGLLQKLFVHQSFVYWLLGTDQSLGNGTRNAWLMRTLKDGSSPASDSTLVTQYFGISSNRGLGITADDQLIYWTSNLFQGAVASCPLAGAPLASWVGGPLRAPQSLLRDGSRLYVQHETKPYEYALSSCLLPTCESSPPLALHLSSPEAFAVDDRDLYVATTEQDVSPHNSEVETVSRLRRSAKPDPEAP